MQNCKIIKKDVGEPASIKRLLIQYKDGFIEHLSGDRIENRLEKIRLAKEKETNMEVVNLLNLIDRIHTPVCNIKF